MGLFIAVLIITTVLNGAFLLIHYWLLARAMDRQHAQVLQELSDFVSSPGEGQPSPLASFADLIIDRLSASVVMRFKTTLMGVESASSKAAAQVANAVMEDSNPIFGALSSAFPSLGKVLRKNPGALSALSQLKMPGVAVPSNGGSHASSYNPNKYK